MSLQLVPVTLREARAFVDQVHRHRKAPRGGKFAVGAAQEEELVGVAIVGRPVSRHLDDGWTVEVTRVATTGARNACSMLYGAAWRAARAMGYRRAVTYTLPGETGGSVRAAGWRVVGSTKAEGWDRPSRPRVDEYPEQRKLRWEREPVTMPTFELEARSGSGRTWRPTSWRQLALLLPGSRYEGQATEWVDQQLEKGAELDFGHMVIRRQGGGHGKG